MAFRITPEWISKHGAGGVWHEAQGSRTWTIAEAVGAALDENRSRARWVVREVLHELPPRECVRYACRRARSVPQSEASERALSLAERWAASSAVTAAELRMAARVAWEEMATAEEDAAAWAASSAVTAAEVAIHATRAPGFVGTLAADAAADVAIHATRAVKGAKGYRAAWLAAAEDLQELVDQRLEARGEEA